MNVTGGGDGVIRSLPLVLRANGEVLPSMALTVSALYARRPRVLEGGRAPASSPLPDAAIPVGEADTMLINYLGPPSQPGQEGMFPVIPFVDVLEREFRPRPRARPHRPHRPHHPGRGRAPHADQRHTRMWGVEVMANAIETVLDQRYLVRAGVAPTVAGIVALALVAALLVALASPWIAAAGTAIALAGYLTLAVLVFEQGSSSISSIRRRRSWAPLR